MVDPLYIVPTDPQQPGAKPHSVQRPLCDPSTDGSDADVPVAGHPVHGPQLIVVVTGPLWSAIPHARALPRSRSFSHPIR